MITFKELSEAHKVGDKVVIKHGPKDVKGKTGRIGEIRKGLYKGAPKTITVDYDHNETTGQAKSVQVKSKHIQGVKEQVENLQEKHRVSVTLSDPHHPAVTQRKELIQKTVRVKADNPGHAVDSAIHHFRKAGYKVHDHHYIGTVKEGTMSTFKELDEISQKLAGNYYAAVVKEQAEKTGLKPDLYHKLDKKHQKGIDRATDRLMTKEDSDLEEGRGSADKHWDIAQGHKEKASLATKGTEKYHSHMADYHDSMHRYHSDIGQTSHASAHADKAEIHHEKAYEASRSKNEEVAANNVGGGNIAGTQGDAGKKAVMSKKPMKRQVVQFKEFADAELEEGKNGLWANIHAKRKRIKNGSGERMRKPGSKGAPTAQDFKDAQEEVEVQFDMIEEFIEQLALSNNVDAEQIWEDLESIEDEELLEYAIDKKGHKSSEGGLTQKGVDAYNRKTGGNLKTAVTTPPSKLKPGSKAAKRRKSFCARMGGMKKRLTSAKTANDPDSRINKALRKWNC